MKITYGNYLISLRKLLIIYTKPLNPKYHTYRLEKS